MQNITLRAARPLARPFRHVRTLATAARERGPYKRLDAADLDALRGMLETPDRSVISALEGSKARVDPSELDQFNNDWMQKYSGRSQVVIKPRTTAEVSKILGYCARERIAVVPQGGNTGLVGGSVPVHDELVISLASLNQIRSFDAVSGTLACDAGCVLQTLDDHIAPQGYLMPLDLGAKGSCHIGGNIATNAGGLRLLRYGSLHGTVLGLEVVLPDEEGTVLSVGMGGLRKDNTGYDLKQLFIGAEGTLGIITGLSILTPRRSSAQNVAVLAVASYDSIQKVFTAAREQCGEILSAFEFFDQEAHDMVLKHTGQSPPLEQTGERQFYALIETSGSNKDHDDAKLEGLLEHLLESGMVSDGVLAQDASQVASLWSLRESIPEAAGKLGKTYKYDVSLPVSRMYDLVLATRERFKSAGLEDKIHNCIGYGHIGDGNLHLNVIAKDWSDEVASALEPWVYGRVQEDHGSISAEHGLGLQKAPYIRYSQSETAVKMMRRIKDVFDPHHILNPYKYILPEEAGRSLPSGGESPRGPAEHAGQQN